MKENKDETKEIEQQEEDEDADKETGPPEEDDLDLLDKLMTQVESEVAERLRLQSLLKTEREISRNNDHQI